MEGETPIGGRPDASLGGRRRGPGKGTVIALVAVAVLGVFGAGYTSSGHRAAAAAPSAAQIAVPVIHGSPRPAQFGAAATAGVAKLASMYDAASNKATRSWRAANVLAALTQYMQASGSRAYLADVQQTYLQHHGVDDFINRFYDDEGWWALTWIRAYDLTGDSAYLGEARYIFANMTLGWTPACGGGVLWSKFSDFKDAISNELFLAAAAGLYHRLPRDTQYLHWALREWRWFQRSGMLISSGLVLDGLRGCKPQRGSARWTYNQGMLIGGLLALEQVTRQKSLLRLAGKTANAVLHSPELSPGGILREPSCGSLLHCGADAPTFKGIFVQNLKLLHDRLGHPAYQRYLLRNAQSVWVHDRRGLSFGLDWAGPYSGSNMAREVSAVFLLITQVNGPPQAARPASAGPAAAPG